MHFAGDGFWVSDVGGVVSFREGCENGSVGDEFVSAVADLKRDASGREEQPVLDGLWERWRLPTGG